MICWKTYVMNWFSEQLPSKLTVMLKIWTFPCNFYYRRNAIIWQKMFSKIPLFSSKGNRGKVQISVSQKVRKWIWKKILSIRLWCELNSLITKFFRVFSHFPIGIFQCFTLCPKQANNIQWQIRYVELLFQCSKWKPY